MDIQFIKEKASIFWRAAVEKTAPMRQSVMTQARRVSDFVIAIFRDMWNWAKESYRDLVHRFSSQPPQNPSAQQPQPPAGAPPPLPVPEAVAAAAQPAAAHAAGSVPSAGHSLQASAFTSFPGGVVSSESPPAAASAQLPAAAPTSQPTPSSYGWVWPWSRT